MSGYPNQPSGYGYGYGGAGGYGAPPPTAQPYGSSPYGSQHPPPHSQQPYAPVAAPYGAPSAPYGSNPSEKPHKDKPNQSHGGVGGSHQSYGGHGYPPPSAYGSPFASLLPSAFPPGTDPSIVTCFQVADQDGSGFIDDKELQGVLSSYNQRFSIRTVHLLMYHFTNTNTRKIGNLTYSLYRLFVCPGNRKFHEKKKRRKENLWESGEPRLEHKDKQLVSGSGATLIRTSIISFS
ncbi:probable calcium-binding protein CML49 isoform X2 [Cucurbita moschata]|uniref:Probable calcium-binding protein CML49 isoform X2 n=1 Tax=Cucurbita moschata TaxID=3662 RepID=A0A6J1EH99_CUCMO|nr:probable calcium-binding protein CML49 isoform X2 [Cucurbita moschata]